MPLPTSDTTWPPTDDRVQHALADWDAWYASDPDRLEARYSGRGFRDAVDRPSQHRGGVVGRLARWFWGNPTPEGEKRDKLHVPLAGDIARTSSELLFSEPPKLLAAEGASDATQQALDALMENGLQPTLLEAGEICAALGGAYLRVVWDDEVSDRPWIDTVAADRAVPEFRYGRLSAVTFWTVLETEGRNDNRVFRHLERHERGRIFHGLYEGSATSLGGVRPLADHPVTAPLAAEVDAEGGLDTGARDHLTAAYVPNVRPARAWRHIPTAAYWGQSDFQGIEGLMDALDETYSSWMRDVQNGKGRIIVAQSMLDSLGPGQGAAWSEERRIYTGLSMLPRPGDPNPITSVQFEIRVAEHRDTCQALMEQAVRQAGYSAGSFGESDGQAVTATEVKARNRRSLSTAGRKGKYWQPGVSDITAAYLAVLSGPRFRVSGLDLTPPKVELQDGVTEGPIELATTAELLSRAMAASRETLVQLVHPDWDDAQVTAEVARLKDEQTMADPVMTGAEGPGGGFPAADAADEGAAGEE
ncbi:phage portal protein [Streptomyces scabiei]|uniref:phage portal protein n=1 Tax=Streptomyces scabiei TaxID=1930 RepID=UPI001B31A853|nr:MULTISPECIES: phage portal protein [Streptomyces]MBP5883167.1 phage portal protein [Streptomyces sp. LBUM 1487]MDX2626807.1 phage portal protein [Streptomyces scabiei]MDX3162744.1 phage portal protein [Streptomyces scabiei]